MKEGEAIPPTSVTCEEEEESGAEYLKSVMTKLQSERLPSVMWNSIQQEHTTEAELEASASQDTKQNFPLPPPQPLSKEELAALYQAAINKGAVLDLAGMTSGSVQNMQALQNLIGMHMGNMNKDNTKNVKQQTAATNTVNKPASQMASMVPTAMMIIDSGTNKSVEPLFMAIAGFVGMALMFAFSVLFMPKFGNLRSRGISALKHAPDELAALTKLVLEGIDGKDCSERIACEIGRGVRKMQLDKKPIRHVQ
ncbi:hypothetical protein C0J52_11841 [Blattella germanica]|nr:hypothetical protein C0J52_11841 [Blattella germanica]